ncbi:hypothetical protein HPP92_007050 [Vanilla planifolia]|uniref:Uncharacterized protein n=1 Tax=Vanilla planifolia TaxID=51239 RepID=A0A835RQM2_VANPL|nr:hypothetical protein HPP92_007050 [Vanilla planifolia]
MDSRTSSNRIEFKRTPGSQKKNEKHFFPPPAPSASYGRRLPRRPPPEPPPNQTRVRPTSQTRARVPPGLVTPRNFCDPRRPRQPAPTRDL